MRRAVIWKLSVMGFISGNILGFVIIIIRILSGFLSLASCTLSFYRWLLAIAVYGIAGVGIAMLFPIWQRYVKIRGLFLQSIAFWLVLPIMLVMIYACIFFGFSAAFQQQLLNLTLCFVGEFVAGICFYLVGKWLGFAKLNTAP